MPCCFTPNPDPLAPQPTHTVVDCCTLKIHLTDDSAVQTFNLLSLDYEINAGSIYIKDGVNLRSVPLDAAYIIFGVADQAALTTLLDGYVAACKCDPPIVLVPETIDTLNCDNTTTPITFDAPLQRVVIVQDKPFVVCKSNIDFEIGCSSIDGRTIVRTYVQNEDGTITSAVFEQDGITLVTDGSILIKCEKDYEDVELCHQDITDNSIKYRQVIIYDTETNVSVSEIWLNSLGAIIAVPTNIEACTEVEEIDKVVTNWLPICVDGVQWYVAEQILFNNATQTEVLTKIYKEGANGAIVTVAPTGTIVDGSCPCISTPLGILIDW
jgi:hypothetical protein